MIVLFITTTTPANGPTPAVDNRPAETPTARTQAQESLFPLGRIVTTPGAKEILDLYPGLAATLLNRHITGDWGEVCEADAMENDLSVEHGFRVFSVYRSPAGDKLWLITEADRSATTFLLPSEY